MKRLNIAAFVTGACITMFSASRLASAGAQQSDGRNPGNAVADVRWPAPVLTDSNLGRWLTFMRPTADELKWRNIRWHTSLGAAMDEARRLQRPILLWTMNGNPCGET